MLMLPIDMIRCVTIAILSVPVWGVCSGLGLVPAGVDTDKVCTFLTGYLVTTYAIVSVRLVQLTARELRRNYAPPD
jgi:hypothetical protein